MNDEDRKTLDRMMIRGGPFVSRLAYAAAYADSDNLDKLKAAFPELWERYGADKGGIIKNIAQRYWRSKIIFLEGALKEAYESGLKAGSEEGK